LKWLKKFLYPTQREFVSDRGHRQIINQLLLQAGPIRLLHGLQYRL
jgi:hypothetical protein